MAKKILVIEDERATRNSIVTFLESEGFQTLIAENGRQGIDLAQRYLPDLIICDILMPELDGYDVLTKLQQEMQTASIPFIFLTVTATEAGLRQSIDMGADDYLSKPVTSERLRQAIALQLAKQEALPGPPLPDLSLQSNRSSIPSIDRSDSSRPFDPGCNDWQNQDWQSRDRQSHDWQSHDRQSSDRQNSDWQSRDRQSSNRQSHDWQQLLQSKDFLFLQLSQGVRQQMLSLIHTIYLLKQKPDPQATESYLQELQEISTRLLVLVNEVTALHHVMTPENAETLLKQFNHSEKHRMQ
ncbi:MAG: response regulator [Elainella sp. Prado103]|nr:response regulator [Elainella sp. Prado103]